LIGYFEGVDSERDIAWRAADSLSLRVFLGVGLEDDPTRAGGLDRDAWQHRALGASRTVLVSDAYAKPGTRAAGRRENRQTLRRHSISACSPSDGPETTKVTAAARPKNAQAII
jgi:hypothetical protein